MSVIFDVIISKFGEIFMSKIDDTDDCNFAERLQKIVDNKTTPFF